jgi:hypothetical protein
MFIGNAAIDKLIMEALKESDHVRRFNHEAVDKAIDRAKVEHDRAVAQAIVVAVRKILEGAS